MVAAGYQSAVGTGIDDIGILWARGDPPGFASTNVIPIRPIDGEIGRPAVDPHRAVVLLRPIDVVREIVVCDDAIELGGRLGFLAPGPATVQGNFGSAVVAQDHP